MMPEADRCPLEIRILFTRMKNRLQNFESTISVVLDIGSLLLAGFLSEWLSTKMSFEQYTRSHADIIYLVFTFLPILYLFDIYYPLRNFRSYRSVVRVLLAVLVFGFLLLLVANLQASIGHPPYHNRTQFLIFLTLLFGLLYSTRVGISLLRKGVFLRNAVIIGNSKNSHLLMDYITGEQRKDRTLGFKIHGYVADEESEPHPNGLRYLGRVTELPAVRKRYGISLMIYASDTVGNFEASELIVHERLQGIPLISAVGLYKAITGRVPYRYIDAAWLIEECLRSNQFSQIHLKNFSDKALAILMLLASLPLLLVCVILIKRESPGPAFFIQQRIGRFGQPFNIYKLRTMHPANGDQPTAAEGWHHRQEARITPLGRILRRTHIDELPQLFNVLKGEMSLIGPRPEMEIFIQECEKKIPFYRLRLDVKPGITGWAQVAFRHTSSLQAYEEKFEYELYYLSHLSLGFDLEILARTLFVLCFRRSR